MLAKDIMIPTPLQCHQKMTLTEVSGMLLENHLDGLPVVDDGGDFVGYFGRRQLYKALHQHKDPQMPVRELMITNVMTVSPDTALTDLYPLRNTIMPVLEKRKILGVITRELVAMYSNLEAHGYSPQTMATFDAAYEGIIIINNDLQVLTFNRAAEDSGNQARKHSQPTLSRSISPW